MSFSPKKYFSKIKSPDVLVHYYKMHDIDAFFEIGEQTPRKQAIEIMLDFYNSLEPSKKYDISRELALLESISNKFTPTLFVDILKKNGTVIKELEIECVSDHDKTMYFYTHHNDVVDEVLFYNDFYKAKGYMLYESKEIALDVAESKMTECEREFKRLANKDYRVTECDMESKVLNDMMFVNVTFDGSPLLNPTKNKETGEIDRKNTTRKLEQVRIVYLPKDREVLISTTLGKQEKIYFLDTFLRIVCDSAYEDKIQSFDLSQIKSSNFDFKTSNKGVPLLNWKIKAIAISYGDGKSKKKIRISLPSSVQENGLIPLSSAIEEIGIGNTFKSSIIENISLSFSFTDIEKSDKNVNVSCSISTTKSSLSPLFPYDRYARILLKLSGIDRGFIEKITQEKEKVEKKWEV